MSDDFTAYFLNSPASSVPYETLEISHPNFTRTYYLVRNAKDGMKATLETSETVDFEYRPMNFKPAGSSDDLEQSIQCDLGDLGETVPQEVDAVDDAGGWGIKPSCFWRTFRSDDLSAPIFGPLELEITNFAFTREGASFEAKAPSLNVSRTGERYSTARFPMLRGFM